MTFIILVDFLSNVLNIMLRDIFAEGSEELGLDKRQEIFITSAIGPFSFLYLLVDERCVLFVLAVGFSPEQQVHQTNGSSDREGNACDNNRNNEAGPIAIESVGVWVFVKYQ